MALRDLEYQEEFLGNMNRNIGIYYYNNNNNNNNAWDSESVKIGTCFLVQRPESPLAAGYFLHSQ